MRTSLEVEPRVRVEGAGEFKVDPNDAQKQKGTAYYQTPKPPARTREVAGTPPPPAYAGSGSDATVTINLESMPLPQFVTAIFNGILKLNVSIDPQIAQRTDMVSLRSGKSQNEEQIFVAAQAVLRSYGVNVREFNGLVRVTPDGAKTGVLPEILRGRALPEVPEGLRPIFYLAELENTTAAQAVNWMRTLFPGRITATEDNARNSIMLSGETDAVKAALEALQMLDQPLMRGRSSARIVPTFWSAEEMAKRLVDLLLAEGYAASQAAVTSSPILVLPIAPVNSVIVFAANPDLLNHALRWARELDQSPPGRGGGYITYHVRNTDAAELAMTLKEVMGEAVSAAPVATPTSAADTGSATTSQTTSSAAVRSSAGSKVVVNKQANSLIIKTTPAEYQQWYGLLKELDRPSRTALVMATVAEVYLDESESYGFSWMLKQFQAGGHLINTGVSSSPGTTADVAEGTFRFAVANSSGDPRALITALASTNRSRVLANPSVMARNGETATIQVGQEVPITTSTVTTAATSTTGTVTQNSVQYRSTGVILKVKPVIHAGGRIEIDVSQEVSSAATNTTSGISSPVISTRKIDTKLSVSEGNTILLGGLIRSDATKNIGGIPYLKDVPYVGALFRTSHEEAEKRTELIVMLTPYVVEDDFDARSVTEAFRNQLAWAGEAPPLKLLPREEARGAEGADVPSPSVREGGVDAAEGSSGGAAIPGERAPAPGGAVPDGGAAGSTEGSGFRSAPYALPEKDPEPAPKAASVAPIQQTPPPIRKQELPVNVNEKNGVIDSASVQDLPKQAGEARPVTDDALKRELLEAIQRSGATGER